MPSSDYANLSVLIVDDFHNFRTTLAKNMYALGFRSINSVSSGNEAINLCRKNHYDVILSDYNLGSGKTGQQFLEEMRFYKMVKRSDIFMLISADTSRDVVMASYDCEPNDYLSKPITGKTLEQRIKRQMAKRAELVNIYQAIDDLNYSRAIRLLEAALQKQSRYTVDCQKLLGEMYITEKRFDEAELLYIKILEARDVDWAQVGLANVDLERGKVDDAVSALDYIVQDYPSYLKAYDCLSKAYVTLGDSEKLQNVLEQAAAISPMSIGRQKILADTALENGDIDVAMKAYKKTIKYGANSHYDSVDNHLNLARAITKIYDNDIDKAKAVSLDAVKLLNGIDNQYDTNEEQKIQAKLLHSQINAMNGNKRASDELFSEAKLLIEESPNRHVINEIESVNTLMASGSFFEAKEAINEMLVFYANDQAALEKIDPLLEEPVSEKGKKLIGSINKKGIDFYSSGDFTQSMSYFLRAQKKYPRYIGLKLNLIQAMIGEIRVNGISEEYANICASTFKVVERYVGSDSDKYQRYKQLKLMYRQVVIQAEHDAANKLKEDGENE